MFFVFTGKTPFVISFFKFDCFGVIAYEKLLIKLLCFFWCFSLAFFFIMDYLCFITNFII